MSDVRAFTLSHDGLVNVLGSKCHICQAYDPSSEPALPMSEYNAIWDTGATGSVISARVVRELKLEPTGMRQVHTASGTDIVNTYLINIGLPNKVRFALVPVTEAQLSGTDVLIGMDIISVGDFAITNKDGKTTFSFQLPATHKIDFVEEDRARKEAQAHTPIINPNKTVGRNDPCPCGSGKKYKNCCLNKQ